MIATELVRLTRGMLTMEQTDYEALCNDARTFAQLDEAKIRTLNTIAVDVSPKLAEVTDMFYQHLLSIPRVQPFLNNRVDSLQISHEEWLQGLFLAQFDAAYTRSIYSLGGIHGEIQLPAEFMSGAMSIIQGYLIRLLREVYAEQPEILLESLLAINAALGFSLYIMQEAYQSSSLDNELERFLAITGMSRSLFENLAKAYR